MGRSGERRELQTKEMRETSTCAPGVTIGSCRIPPFARRTVTTAAVHNNHTHAGETCLPTGDLEEPQQPLNMSPSNREVIAQDNLSEDGRVEKVNVRVLVGQLIAKSLCQSVSPNVSLVIVHSPLLIQTLAASQPTRRLVEIYTTALRNLITRAQLMNRSSGQIISETNQRFRGALLHDVMLTFITNNIIHTLIKLRSHCQ